MEDPSDSQAPDRCGCHGREQSSSTSRLVVIKLVAAAGLGVLFMVAEFTGGYFANSLAVLTDAAHMLTDITSFSISLLAIYLGRQQPSKYFNYGWKRAEVLGALLTVLVMLGIIVYIFYESIRRLTHPDSFEVDPSIMLISGCIGIFINIALCGVLYGYGHTHSHGHTSNAKEEDKAGKGKKTNINLRAAMIHVIGDLLQTIGVLVAGYIIWFRRDLKIVDPICTLIFAVIMTATTIGILRDIIWILLEAVPRGISFVDVRDDLCKVKGVKQVHSLYVWSITPDVIALASHLAIDAGEDHDEVLGVASTLLRKRYGISYITIQVEPHNPDMDTCKICARETSRIQTNRLTWGGGWFRKRNVERSRTV